MKHLGDITKLNGAKIPPVWVITGGSPCQDLSVAGKRAGLAGARSGLYMEQIRIIKEMRAHDKADGRTGELVRPRYMVWENVPGAFSSNKGEDFRAVLEEAAHVSDEAAAIPGPPNGKWPTAGCVMGSGWSLAWRVMDAQYWGVPQRRRRIALVADFGGQSAPEILFERKSVSGDIAEGGNPWQGAATDAEDGAGTSGFCLEDQGGQRMNVNEGITGTLRAEAHHPPCVMQSSGFCTDNSAKSRSVGYEEERSPTLRAGGVPGVAIENHPTDGRCKVSEDGKVQTLTSRMGTGGNQVPLTFGIGNGQANQEFTLEQTGALNCMHDQKAIATLQNTGRGWWNQSDIAECIRTPCGGDSTKANLASDGYAVRRLTPLECERLQGYPDGWTDIGEWTDSKGKVHKPSDSARYKALGNSIALPQWRYVLGNIAERLPHGAELGSLFDGIGGFPLVWSEINGEEACLWASEIEEFPIAVTKRWFPEGGENDKIDRNA